MLDYTDLSSRRDKVALERQAVQCMIQSVGVETAHGEPCVSHAAVSCASALSVCSIDQWSEHQAILLSIQSIYAPEVCSRWRDSLICHLWKVDRTLRTLEAGQSATSSRSSPCCKGLHTDQRGAQARCAAGLDRAAGGPQLQPGVVGLPSIDGQQRVRTTASRGAETTP